MDRRFRDVAGALLAGLFAGGAAAQVPEEPTVPPSHIELARCERPLAKVILIESAESGGEKQEMRGMMSMAPKAPALAPLARRVAEASGCYTVLESDPLLYAIPGGVQPDVVLRLALKSAVPEGRNLFEHAEAAARRYVGRWLGGGEEEPQRLKSVEVAVTVLCAKQRRAIREFAARDEGELEGGLLSGEGVERASQANAERIARAFARTHASLAEFLRSTSQVCGE